MKLSQKQISKIDEQIIIDKSRQIVEIDVSNKNDNWSYDEARNNIYCVDNEFNIIWQVNEDEESRFEDEDPFYGIKEEENKIKAIRFSGFIYEVNITTGKVTRIGFQK